MSDPTAPLRGGPHWGDPDYSRHVSLADLKAVCDHVDRLQEALRRIAWESDQFSPNMNSTIHGIAREAIEGPAT